MGVKRGTNNTFPVNTRVVRGDDLIIGNMLFYNKGAPSARFRINPYIDLNIDTGKINVDPDLENRIRILDLQLEGKLDSGEDKLGIAGIELLDEGSSYITTGDESNAAVDLAETETANGEDEE